MVKRRFLFKPALEAPSGAPTRCAFFREERGDRLHFVTGRASLGLAGRDLPPFFYRTPRAFSGMACATLTAPNQKLLNLGFYFPTPRTPLHAVRWRRPLAKHAAFGRSFAIAGILSRIHARLALTFPIPGVARIEFKVLDLFFGLALAANPCHAETYTTERPLRQRRCYGCLRPVGSVTLVRYHCNSQECSASMSPKCRDDPQSHRLAFFRKTHCHRSG